MSCDNYKENVNMSYKAATVTTAMRNKVTINGRMVQLLVK